MPAPAHDPRARGIDAESRAAGAVVAATSRRRSASSTRCSARSACLAASQGTMNNLTFGDAAHQYYETIAGGSGAGAQFDGASGVQTHMTNSRLTDPEVLESRTRFCCASSAIAAARAAPARIAAATGSCGGSSSARR
jgi:5-oxoprolinase (ATP-hydrolysing)